MAEKVELFELNIDIKKVEADIRATQVAIKQLTEESNKLKETEGELSDAYIESQSNLKVLKDELRQNQKISQTVIAANEANTGSIDQMRKQLSVVSIQWARLSKDERENTELGRALTKQKLELTEALKREEKATGDNRRNVGNYSAAIKEATGTIGNFIPGIGGASQAVSGFGAAFKIALGPIGLVITAIGFIVSALRAFFTSSEEGQNTLRKLQATFKVVFGNISDVLSGIGKQLFEIFENPKQAIKDFAELIKDNVINRFKGILELIPNLGKSIALLFKGEFKEAGKVAADAVGKVVLGVDNLTDKVSEGFDKATEALKKFKEEQEREIKIAQRLADLQASIDKKERAVLVERAKLEREIAENKLKSKDKEKFTDLERIEFLKQAFELETKIAENEESLAKKRLFVRQETNKLSNSTKEDLIEEAQLQAALIKVQTDKFNKQKELQAEITAQEKENTQKQLDIQISAIQYEIAKFKTGQNELFKTRQERAEREAELQIQLAEKSIKNEDERAARILEIDKTKNDLIKAANQEARLIEAEAKFEAQKETFIVELDRQRFELDEKRKLEIKAAEEVGADITNIEQKYSNARKEIDKAEFNAKLSLYGDFANNIAQIAGESTAVGKAAAVASTLISTYQGAVASYTSLASLGPWGIAAGVVAAAAAVASGLANVKKILSVKTGLPGDKSPSVSGGGASTPSAPPAGNQLLNPSLNQGIISRQTIESQQNAVTVQPTLVIDSVTSAQKNENTNTQISTI